jgi:hypothetical protein
LWLSEALASCFAFRNHIIEARFASLRPDFALRAPAVAVLCWGRGSLHESKPYGSVSVECATHSLL